MTLPGGVLLALDPTWDETQVENFFSESGISANQVFGAGLHRERLRDRDRIGFPIA